MRVVHLENKQADARRFRFAFERLGVACTIKHFQRSSQTLSWLQEQGADLLVLDSPLHGDDRDEVVRALGTEPALRTIPVVVLSSLPPGRQWKAVPQAVRCELKPSTAIGWELLARELVDEFDPADGLRRLRRPLRPRTAATARKAVRSRAMDVASA